MLCLKVYRISKAIRSLYDFQTGVPLSHPSAGQYHSSLLLGNLNKYYTTITLECLVDCPVCFRVVLRRYSYILARHP